MTHVMLDLETWGTGPGSALRSIGACVFDPELGYGSLSDDSHDIFYANIDRASCEAEGLTIDPDTVFWWSQQSDEAQAALLTEPQPLRIVIAEFKIWWFQRGAKFVWSNGASFDEVLWRAACEKVGVRPPWHYRNVRDTRTIWDVAGIDPKNIQRSGTKHNALTDARHQALCVMHAYDVLRGCAFAPPQAVSDDGSPLTGETA
jgi:hypothetical protein